MIPSRWTGRRTTGRTRPSCVPANDDEPGNPDASQTTGEQPERRMTAPRAALHPMCVVASRISRRDISSSPAPRATPACRAPPRRSPAGCTWRRSGRCLRVRLPGGGKRSPRRAWRTPRPSSPGRVRRRRDPTTSDASSPAASPLALTRTTEAARSRWFDDYVNVVIERDVLELARVRQRALLPRLLTRLAAQTGQLLNIAKAADDLSMDRSTAENYTKLLEAVFLTRRADRPAMDDLTADRGPGSRRGWVAAATG